MKEERGKSSDDNEDTTFPHLPMTPSELRTHIAGIRLFLEENDVPGGFELLYAMQDKLDKAIAATMKQ